MPRAIAFRLYIAWDGSNYVNESSRLIEATGENKLTPPDQVGSGRGQVDRCTLLLSNHDGRYSPLNSAGALYSYIQNGGAYHRPMYLQASIDGGSNYYNIFWGVIKLPQETTPTPTKNAITRIDCRSSDELLLGKRMSTAISNLTFMNSSGYTEGDIINLWVQLAGKSATCDKGCFIVKWAWMDDESVLDEIWQLAAACAGRFYCDPDGTFRYEDATHWLKAPHTTSQETITRADFTSLEPVYTDTELYNQISVEASARELGAPTELWKPDEPVVIPPNSTKTMTARLRQPAYSITSIDMQAATSGGVGITANVTVSIVTSNVQRLELSITNSHASEAAYLSPFTISGRSLTGGPTQEETRTSSAHGNNAAWWTGRGDRSKNIRGNFCIQTRAHAAALALYMLHRSEALRLTYRIKGCPGKPTRRGGDRVTINDTAIMSSARDAFITGISWRLTQNGFTQDLEAIDAGGLYPYQAEGYFVIGTHTLGASTKPIFY